MLILQGTQSRVDLVPRAQWPAQRHHGGLCTDVVFECAPVCAPVAAHVAIDGHAVQPDVVGVPRVLPLGGFDRQIEAVQELREVQSRGQIGVTEAIELAMKSVPAGVLHIGLERRAGREGIGAGDRHCTVAEAAVEVRRGTSAKIGRLEKVVEKIFDRVGRPPPPNCQTLLPDTAQPCTGSMPRCSPASFG